MKINLHPLLVQEKTNKMKIDLHPLLVVGWFCNWWNGAVVDEHHWVLVQGSVLVTITSRKV